MMDSGQQPNSELLGAAAPEQKPKARWRPAWWLTSLVLMVLALMAMLSLVGCDTAPT